ncbi:MAG TPA: SPOR domain-containing protein [Tepidisphaeraceae bacterium]
MLVAALLIGGCAANQATDLDTARTALAAKDYDAAQSAAQAYLLREPGGPRAAEAHYLKGRAIEDRSSKTQPDALARLQAARGAYVAALAAKPADKTLEGLIRASLADVAFWQEDYTTAAEQGLAGQGLVADEGMRAWVAYRVGVAQKRLGNFIDGDRTLAEVVRNFPGTVPAGYAEARLGMNAFYVHLGAFSVAGLADQTVAAVKAAGLAAATKAAGNQTTVFAGPFKTYAEAKVARDKLGSRYASAQVLP